VGLLGRWDSWDFRWDCWDGGTVETVGLMGRWDGWGTIGNMYKG